MAIAILHEIKNLYPTIHLYRTEDEQRFCIRDIQDVYVVSEVNDDYEIGKTIREFNSLLEAVAFIQIG